LELIAVPDGDADTERDGHGVLPVKADVVDDVLRAVLVVEEGPAPVTLFQRGDLDI